jgi:DNA processing protein
MSAVRYWIALSMVPDVGPVRARRLLSVFRSPENIFDAKMNELKDLEGIGLHIAKNIREFSLWKSIEKQMGVMEKKGIQAVCMDDPSYPEMLREAEGSPVVLYMKGDVLPEDRYSIAVVGSRTMTDYGASVAERFSGDLATMGFTVVSGMARGIDSLAHKAAIKARGRTIAVLGSGLDVPYPPENKFLMEKIASSGCVMSEFPPGTPPDKENFPRRNRLISGLSLGVLVIEAAATSGALITARYANDQGRTVFAVPGNITSQKSDGTNRLIREGAVPVRSAEEIVGELAPVLKGFIRLKEELKIEVNDDEKILCNLLSGEPKQVDIIARESSWPASKVLGTLLGLELKGAVKQITGKRFYLA